MLNCVMREAGVGPAQTIMVGDTCADVKMAQAAGSVAVAVTWGYHDIAHLTAQNPDYMVHSFDELAVLIDDLTR
jgi:phosphoglycolate phosphatase